MKVERTVETSSSERAGRPKRKVALVAFPERWALPGRPSNASPVMQDAHRQTGFLLGADLNLFERSMNLQLQAVAENAKARTPAAAALLSFWSRVFSSLSDACVLMTLGSYVSCPALLRAACDCIAVQRSLCAEGFEDYEEWFTEAVRQAREQQALAFDLGRFRASSVIAEDERLGPAYRLLTDLAMPHFGSTALQTAPDSGLQRLSLTFGDQSFHLGWAELITGWLLLLASAQIHTAARSGVFSLSDALHTELAMLSREIDSALASSRRCRAEEVEGRFLLHNFRRRSGGAPKRVML